MICHQAWFVQKSYYSSVGGYETTYPSGGDYRFLLRMLLHDDVKYHRVPKVLLYYKGGGVSQQENILHKANQWVDELRQEIFTRYEYTFFSFIWKLRDVLKVILYDFLLYKGWRYVQKTRALF
jgi:hypothetical protein